MSKEKEMKEEKLPIHIKITDNETGKVMMDIDADCIIGSVHTGEGKVQSVGCVHCNKIAFAETLVSLDNVAQVMNEKEPTVSLLKHLLQKSSAMKKEIEEEYTYGKE